MSVCFAFSFQNIWKNGDNIFFLRIFVLGLWLFCSGYLGEEVFFMEEENVKRSPIIILITKVRLKLTVKAKISYISVTNPCRPGNKSETLDRTWAIFFLNAFPTKKNPSDPIIRLSTNQVLIQREKVLKEKSQLKLSNVGATGMLLMTMKRRLSNLLLIWIHPTLVSISERKNHPRIYQAPAERKNLRRIYQPSI